MSSLELAEHAGYIADAHRLGAYRQALSQRLAGRDLSVLDLGAGTGILGLLAASAGARIVYAVERGSIIGAAAEVAARSPFAAQITHVQGYSTEIQLPERVDVAVCDQIGGFVHDAGVLRVFADVRKRLLAPGGVLIPARFRLFVAPARCDLVRGQIMFWASKPAGFDFAPFLDAAVNSEHRVKGNEVEILGRSVVVDSFAADHVQPISGSGSIELESDGRLDGLVGWFEADLADAITLTNCPGDPTRIDRWCTFYPTRDGLSIRHGDTLSYAVELRPNLNAVSWTVDVTRGAARISRERRSTLLGGFIAEEELKRGRGMPVTRTSIGTAVRRMLELADGSRSEAEIFEALGHSAVDLDSVSIDRTLRETLRRFTALTGAAKDGHARRAGS